MNLEPSRFFAFRKHLRVSNPPGGVSNLFTTSDSSDHPRKVRDHQKSSIFGADEADSLKKPADLDDEDERNTSSPRYQQDTKQRLFGEVGAEASPRRLNDTWRSNVVFSASVDCLSDEVKRTPRRSPSAGINPVTGQLLLNGSPNQEENGVFPQHTNGVKNEETEENDSAKPNGENGHQNGFKNGDVTEKKPSTRQPPGGKTSGIFG